MDAGSRSLEVAPLTRFSRATMAWMLMMVVESTLGFARELYLAPRMGDMHARQLGVLSGSLVVFLIAWALARWIGLKTRVAQNFVGGLWVVSTLIFETLMGRAIGTSWTRILADYEPWRGGFMLAGLAFMFFTPRLAAWLRYRESTP